jgi:hypothetical protein
MHGCVNIEFVHTAEIGGCHTTIKTHRLTQSLVALGPRELLAVIDPQAVEWCLYVEKERREGSRRMFNDNKGFGTGGYYYILDEDNSDYGLGIIVNDREETKYIVIVSKICPGPKSEAPCDGISCGADYVIIGSVFDITLKAARAIAKRVSLNNQGWMFIGTDDAYDDSDIIPCDTIVDDEDEDDLAF